MNHNKNYFLIQMENVGTNDGTGKTISNISLRNILGQLYDQYNAFAIKLEGYICRTANTAVIADDFLLLHLEGLPFINGFDTCPNYRGSRVLEMIDFSGTSNRGYNFISNCNGVNFWKPSTEKVNLKLFATRISDEGIIAEPDNVNYLLSINCLEAYKIKPKKTYNIPRLVSMNTSNLTLSTYKATSLDARNRAFRFTGVNLRQVIGPNYDKYKKFALITRSYAQSEYNGSGYTSSFSGMFCSNIMISGFSFFRQSLPQYYNSGTLAQQQEINTIHGSQTCIACQVTHGFPSLPSAYKETYVENCFEKSQDTIDIVISHVQMYGYYLTAFNTGNSQLFPHYIFNFDIIPLID